jgi:hypothetical protein
MREIIIEERDLRYLYIDCLMSTKRIADKYSCDSETIRLKLKNLDIKRRRTNIRTIKQLHIPKRSTELSYMAGIVDGEGSVMCVNAKKSKDGVLPRVSVRNTDKKLMDWIVGTFGGVYYTAQPPISHPHHKVSYRWHVDTTLDIVGFLRAIKQYLIIKRDSCDKVLQYCEEKLAQHGMNCIEGSGEDIWHAETGGADAAGGEVSHCGAETSTPLGSDRFVMM